MSRARKTPKTLPVELKRDELVLLGQPGTLLPRDWYRGQVVWSDGDALVVRQWGFSGQRSWNSLTTVDHVRAVGDHRFLSEHQARCAAEVAELQAVVDTRSAAVEEARRAIWARLDEIGAAGAVRQPADAEPKP